MTEIKIAAAQPRSISGDISQNTKILCNYLQVAKQNEADLVVFPELFLCNFDVEELVRNRKKMSVTLDNPNIKAIQDYCKKIKISAVFGVCLDYGEQIGNSAVVINTDGKIECVYDKINISPEEMSIGFSSGNKLQTFEICGFRIGISICFDSGFPEHIRSLALSGAEIVSCLNAFNIGEEEHRYHIYWPMRALENTIYIVSSNAIGDTETRSHFGKSAIFEPSGRVIERANSSEDIIYAVASKSRIEQVRSYITYMRDLRREFYFTKLNQLTSLR